MFQRVSWVFDGVFRHSMGFKGVLDHFKGAPQYYKGDSRAIRGILRIIQWVSLPFYGGFWNAIPDDFRDFRNFSEIFQRVPGRFRGVQGGFRRVLGVLKCVSEFYSKYSKCSISKHG